VQKPMLLILRELGIDHRSHTTSQIVEHEVLPLNPTAMKKLN
jgi:hypothetical protein